ncbi:MAG: hypothetical protein CMD89_04780 [Gammaproteobacteria bacterium]|nr:hypothetical protein [Gammaproteobacteria bacterium]
MKIFLENQLMTLDLHGVRHYEVQQVVEDFILTNQESIPLIIICGNSDKMISLVSQTLTKLNLNFESTNYGRIRVNSLDA